MKRRRFLKLTGLSAVVGAMPVFAAAKNVPVQTHYLNSDQFCLFTIDGINSLAMRSAVGLVVVDSGAAANAQVFVEALEKFNDDQTKQIVHTLFNTHWHDDQCGGNEAIGNGGAEIIAHKKTYLHLATEYYLPPEHRYHHASPKAALPTRKIYTEDQLTVDGNAIDFGYLVNAHTDGDIYVHFKDANILCAGDVASPLRDPGFDWYGGGWLGGRLDALDKLLSLCDDNTQIIPAYGGPMSKQELQAEKDLLFTIYEKLVDLMRKGYSAKDMLDEGALVEFDYQWQDPYKFLYDVYKGLWANHNKLAPNIV